MGMASENWIPQRSVGVVRIHSQGLWGCKVQELRIRDTAAWKLTGWKMFPVDISFSTTTQYNNDFPSKIKMDTLWWPNMALKEKVCRWCFHMFPINLATFDHPRVINLLLRWPFSYITLRWSAKNCKHTIFNRMYFFWGACVINPYLAQN